MKRGILFYLLCIGAFQMLTSYKKPNTSSSVKKVFERKRSNTAPSIPYHWDSVPIGGGGYVTGLVIHPKANDRMYIRTDVGGAYRWDSNKLRWVQILNDLTTKVDGIALDPNAPDRVYVALNDGIYRSDDIGNNWTKKISLKYNGNGDLRWVGEPIAVDPLASEVVYAGTRVAGLYRSADTANTFVQVSSVPTSANVRCVAIDPATKTKGHSAKVYVAVAGTGIYRSVDGGLNFSMMAGGPDQPNRMIINSGKLYVTHSKGVQAWDGNSWTDITPPMGKDKNYSGIAIESHNPLKIAVAQRSSAFANKIFRSDNGATTWEEINTPGLPVKKTLEVPWWPKQWFSSATACLVFDPFNYGELYFTDWFGIWSTKNLWQKGSVDFTTKEKGHEELVVLTVVAPPVGARANLYSGMADVNGFMFTSVTEYPTSRIGNMHEITNIAYCESMPMNIAILNTANNDATGIVLKTSADGGGSFITRTLPSDVAGGRVAISATNPDIMVYVARGPNGLVYHTSDRGLTWATATDAPVGAVQGTADIYSKDFSLVADCVDGSKFYLYKSGKLYRSTDSGATWVVANATSIPNKSSFLFVVARPGKSGEIWVSLEKNGLYRSTDSGNTFTQVKGFSVSTAFDFGAPLKSGGTPTAFCYGTFEGVKGFYRSTDLGSSWEKIDGMHKFPAGVKGIAGDKSIFGRVYVATGGMGIIYGQPLK